MTRPVDRLPLAYSCSGCSSAAQLANHLAVRFDRTGDVEMSCIAGVGGDVPSLVRKLRDAACDRRPIVAIDGCALACVRSTLERHGIGATVHFQLGAYGVRKTYRADFSDQQAAQLLERLRPVVRALVTTSTAPAETGDA